MKYQNFFLSGNVVFLKEKTDTLEHELRREVEDLKLRLQMAADHYKEKFKECQRLQKQINKLSDQSVSVTEFLSSNFFFIRLLFANKMYIILNINLLNTNYHFFFFLNTNLIFYYIYVVICACWVICEG